MKYFLLIFLISFYSCEAPIAYPEGGYAYPENLADTDTSFYYYPLKKIMSKKEAFWASYYYLLYRPFDEPNLSIKSLPKETFRLTYQNAFGKTILVTLSENSLKVKQGNTGDLYNTDTNLLSPIENYHLRLLNRRYPFDTIGKSPRLKAILDSVIKVYPQLLDENYYKSIYEKSLVRSKKDFHYALSNVAISREQYRSLIEEINASGFWKLPSNIDCGVDIADGDGFVLEANTKNRYQAVNVHGCPGDTTRFTKACEHLFKLAKIDKKLVWDWQIDSIKDSK